MRLPIGLYPIGLVLLISVRTGHYGFGGALSAVCTAGTAIGNPLLGRWIDRYGQRRVLLPTTAVHLAAGVVLVALAQTQAQEWTLLAPALAIGLVYPSAGSLTRARWSQAYGSGPTLTTAYSLESTLDEIIFVIGPPIVTVIATQTNPVFGIALAVGLATVGGLWLAGQRGTEPPAHRPVEGVARVAVLSQPGIRLLLLATVGAGAFFASAEVTVVAYCGQHGVRGVGGLALSALALGSATSGLLYGARHWRLDLLARFRLQTAIFGLLPLLYLGAVNVGVLIALNVVIGASIAPTLITVYGLIERIVPMAGLTEGFSWLATAIGVGYGVAAALAGRIDDAFGARTGFLVPCGAALLTALSGFVTHHVLRARPPASQPEPAPAQ